ncbi:MAG: acyl-CoA reductase [Chitinophagaceae bacterium]|nr:MAG: acyl-CoA reductase [Chitinophagaceae bacterium]
MVLQQRLNLLSDLGKYLYKSPAAWVEAKDSAHRENNWFIPDFIEHSVNSIITGYLDPAALAKLVETYTVPELKADPKNVGIVMAGNIPLVGFHDFLCAFLSGNHQTIKLSSKDRILLPHIAGWMIDQAPELADEIRFADMLKGCDAYIATGSNNSARYFDYYFGRFPSIIRRNRTSVAVLSGNETTAELNGLADDIYMYFGLGCRNVTKIYVPAGYDFPDLLGACKKYDHLADHHKFKNNYDYQLSVLLINNIHYMTNGSIILKQDKSIFSPIAVLNYEFYDEPITLKATLATSDDVQCLVASDQLPFGRSQQPGLTDFADGVDTLQFLLGI